MVASGRKLLVLDVNGLLVDTYKGPRRPHHQHDAKVKKFYVYKRPFCKEFLQFCLDRFIVGVWSSAVEYNVLSLVEYIFQERMGELAFIWHQQHCTDTGFRHPDNKFKPVFLKELCKLWELCDPDVPWETGDYGPSNTLLVDDSPYKAINNPPHTAIFPKTYRATNLEDNYLDGELRIYLQGLLGTADVQAYVQENPFGEPCIPRGNSWWFFIFDSVKAKFGMNYSKGVGRLRETSQTELHAIHDGTAVEVYMPADTRGNEKNEKLLESLDLSGADSVVVGRGCSEVPDSSKTSEDTYQRFIPNEPSVSADGNFSEGVG